MALKRTKGKAATLAILAVGITVTVWIGYWLNTSVFTGITLNYMLMGVAFSAIFSNIIPEERLEETVEWFHPVLAVCLLGAIVDLGAPELAVIVKGTIAAAAVINEIIAVLMAKKGFELAGEIPS